MNLKRLKDLRERKDKSKKQIAEYLGISQQHYSLYELNKRLIPVDILVKLAYLYDTSTDYILGLTNIKEPYPKQKKQ